MSAILEVDRGVPAGLGTVDSSESDQQTTRIRPIFAIFPNIAHHVFSTDLRSTRLGLSGSTEKTRRRHEIMQKKTTSGLDPPSWKWT